jgi:glycerol-3-phosphate acyltransferase PlsY
MSALLFIFVVGLAYLSGSICSAVVVSKLFSLPDPRIEGSTNPGATNVLRLAGKKYAAIVLLADILKGLLPVLLAKALNAEPVTLGFTCLAAVLGHMYPVFFGFKGGKGVATAMGALLGLHFILGILVIATWLLVVNFTRYASLASIVSIGLAPFYTLMTLGSFEIFPIIFIIALFVLYKHRTNITRLIDGAEPKIRFNRSTLKDEVDGYLSEQVQEKALTEETPDTEKENQD